jgi:2-methylcitrate dehydratase PrpD
MPTLAERMARFAYSLKARAVPHAVAECAREHILDAVGVGLAASSLPGSDALYRAVRALGAGEEATALGFAGRLPAASAALLNGTLIHSLEYDDTHTGAIVHGSAVVVAAALACAERHGASITEMTRAVLAGWEIFIRMGLAAPGAFQRRGFQITAVGGPFVAALVAAMLARRDEKAAVNAMGIAGSQCAGVFEFLAEGATVKAMHPGWAAHAGLVAAELAAAGMTGPPTILEGAHGFFRAYADDGEAPARLAALLDSLGEKWLIAGAAFKGYPCCHYLHPFLECAERLRAAGLAPSGIAAIECEVPEEEAMLICEPWERKQAPASGYEAKFSLPYALGLVLCGGEAGVREFAGAADHAGALALARRTRWKPWTGSGFPQRFAARIAVRFADGRTLREEVAQVRGAPERPFGRAEIIAKFERNAALALDAAATRTLREAILARGERPAGDLLAGARPRREYA